MNTRCGNWIAKHSIVGFVLLTIPCSLTELTGQDLAVGKSVGSVPVCYRNQADPTCDILGDALPKQALLRLGTVRFRHPSNVTAMELSPDDRFVITLDNDILAAWDTVTGKALWQHSWQRPEGHLSGTAYGQHLLAFARNSNSFYTTCIDDEILKWDVKDGSVESIPFEEPLFNDMENSTGFMSIDVSSSGERFVVGKTPGIAVLDRTGHRLWELKNNPTKPIENDLRNHDRLWFSGHYSLALFSNDEKHLAVVLSEDPKRMLWLDAADGERVHEIPLTDNLVRLAINKNGEQIFATERDCAVRCYSTLTGQRQWEFTVPPNPNSESYLSAVDCSADGKLVAVCASIGADETIFLLNATTGAQTAQLKGHDWKPWAVKFTADASLLYSTGWEGTIRRWDVASATQLPPPQGIRGSSIVAASPTESKIAFVDDQSVIHVLGIDDGIEQAQFRIPDASVGTLCFSPNGESLVAGGSSKNDIVIQFWDLVSGAESHTWRWPKGKDPHATVEALAISSDGSKTAAIVFRQHAAYLWDNTTGQQIAKLPHPEGYGIAISPDGKTVTSVSWDCNIREWSAETGKLLRQLDVREAIPKDQNGDQDMRMYGVCYSPKGDQIAIAHLHGHLSVWETGPDSTPRLTKYFKSDWLVFGAIAFSPDGLWLATGSSAGEISLFDPLSGTKMFNVGKQDNHVYSIGFGSSSQHLVSGAGDESYLWSLVPEPIGEPQTLNQLWHHLGDDQGEVAYRAIWAMVNQPAESISFITNRFSEIESVLDLAAITRGLVAEEVKRRTRLTQQGIEKDRKKELLIRVRRAFAVLRLIDNQASQQLLAQLAAQHPQQVVRDLASSIQ